MGLDMQAPLSEYPGMQELLERIKGLRILVVGDLVLDHYIWGDASRLSPEAPVAIVNVTRDSYTAGGAANVAANLRALGVGVEIIGTIGDDTHGSILLNILNDANISCDTDICRMPTVQTIVKTRVMCRQQQLCRLDREAAPATYALPGKTRATLEARIAQSDAVILSDYAKGTIDSSIIRMIQDCAGPDRIVAMDPKPRTDLDFKAISLLTPNRAEAMQLAGFHGSCPESAGLQEIAARIHERYSPELLVITLGADGMQLCAGGELLRHIPTAAREVFDVSGAGDTVIATLTAALAAGAATSLAAELANLAAGVVVGKVGTAVATSDEIITRFRMISP